MNRRNFLKFTAGSAVATTAVGLPIPVSAEKRQIFLWEIANPVAKLIAENFIDKRIQENILRLKQKNPGLVIGETHCHSNFSDGANSVRDLMVRSADLGLDFMIITEHLTMGRHSLENVLRSFQEQWQQIHQWNHKYLKPATVYPGFEISTAEGHLILVFPQEYLNPKMYPDIKRQFVRFDNEMAPMEQPALLAKGFGGIAIIPHPEIERNYPFGVTIPFIRENLLGLVDAIEDISTGHAYEEHFSAKLDLASIGSSDDHLNLILGTTVTGYDSIRYSDLLSAIKARKTRAIKVEESLTPLFAGLRQIL